MIIKQLIGQTVNLALRDGYVKMEGTLKDCDELFVVIDPGKDKGDVFVPLTAILHLQPITKR